MRQIMGQLPKERITISRPFLTSGIDYAGYFTLKPAGHRSKVRFKGYIAVFLCYCTRAVHLETVSDLMTSALFAALKRFSSRRGCPATIYSDNATNFWGTQNLLADKQIEVYPPDHQISWKFNPPRTPHFGGMFEATVQSMKKHLIKVIGDQILTFEELATLATEVEAVLNSQPISLTSANDLDNYLTPGHFLIGTHLLMPPDLGDATVKLPIRWQLVQELKLSFWHHWRNDYLNGFQKLNKWHKDWPNLKIDDIVFLKDDQGPANKYHFGRVVRVCPGQDGKV